MISDAWNSLDEKKKKTYHNQVEEMKAKHEADMAAWLKKNKLSMIEFKELMKKKKPQGSNDLKTEKKRRSKSAKSSSSESEVKPAKSKISKK